MDELSLPRPHDWHAGNRRVWGFALFCVLGLAVTPAVAITSPVLGLVVLMVLAVVVLAVLQFGEARVVVVRTRTLEVAGLRLEATVFPLRRTAVRLGWLLVVASGAAGVVLLVRGDVAVGAVAVALAGIGAGCWLAIHRDRRGTAPCVALCEQGVVLVRGRAELIAWADLAPVTSDRVKPLLDPLASRSGRDVLVVRAGRSFAPPTPGLLRQYLDEAGGTGPYVYVHRLRCDPVVVYHALRFYQDHPGTRPELGTVAARHRIEARDLLR